MSDKLIQAVRDGNKELAEKLILSGAEVNFRGQNNITPLIEASKNGNKEIIELLIKSNADVHATDDRGVNALMRAAYYGNKDAVLSLLETEIDVNALDNYKNSALMNCVRVKQELIKEEDFKENNIEKNGLSLRNRESTKQPFQKYFPYKLITYPNNMEILQALIKKNTDINIAGDYKKTALIYAVEQENLEAVKIILDCKPNIDHVDGTGSNAFIYATSSNNTNIALVLINSGANVNFLDKLKNTPLTYANESNNEELVKILLSQGADLKIGYLHEIYNDKIQTMFNAAKYVDFLLDKKSTSFEEVGKIDPEILTARYNFLLNKPEIDLQTLSRQQNKLTSCNLDMEDRNKLNKIYENVLSTRAKDPEENAKMLNYSSSSDDLTSSEGSSSGYDSSFSRLENSSDSKTLGECDNSSSDFNE